MDLSALGGKNISKKKLYKRRGFPREAFVAQRLITVFMP